jgi:hypothetical protein
MKIYIIIVEVFRKKERQDETQFTTKIDGFLNFNPCWMLIHFFFILTPCMAKFKVLVMCFPYFMDDPNKNVTLNFLNNLNFFLTTIFNLKESKGMQYYLFYRWVDFLYPLNKKFVNLSIQIYLFIFFIFGFLPKYWCIITYACEKLPPPYELSIISQLNWFHV